MYQDIYRDHNSRQLHSWYKIELCRTPYFLLKLSFQYQQRLPSENTNRLNNFQEWLLLISIILIQISGRSLSLFIYIKSLSTN